MMTPEDQVEVKTCIICRKSLPGSVFGVEHVVPDSIGGTLTLQDVCTDCNSFLGHKVDTHLANHPLIQLARLELGLTGKAEKFKHPLQRGTLENEPEQAITLEFGPEGPPQIYFFPHITRTEEEQGQERIRISVDPSEIGQLPEIVNKILRRKGLPTKAPEEILRHAKRRQVEPRTVHALDLSHGQYRLALLKIAYEFTYYCLGQRYLRDMVGNTIKNAFLDVPITKEWYSRHRIEGLVELVEPPEGDIGTTHELRLMPYGARLLCDISILNLFKARIVTTNYRYAGAGFSGKVISINALTGEKTERAEPE